MLANIVLNELDHWIESQWQNNPVTGKYNIRINSNGSEDKGNGYRAMKNTALKEMCIVRYADDFRIFCRTKTDAIKTKCAVTQWLSERLKLEISEEKTRVVNVKRRYSEFLGFKIKVHPKGKKYVVKSRICDKQLKVKKDKLTEQAKYVAKPREGRTEHNEISLYNSMVIGIQNYYKIATHIGKDCSLLNKAVLTIFKNRLRMQKGSRLIKNGRKLTDTENRMYGGSKQLRFVAGNDEPLYPIGFVQHKNPQNKKRSICQYSQEGRKNLHDNLRINSSLMVRLMQEPQYDRSIEYMDNRISLFSAQWGKCAVTGISFQTTGEIHCHHKITRNKGGSDRYENLTLILDKVHILIHATENTTIDKYIKILCLDKQQLTKLNVLREKSGLPNLILTTQ